MSIEFTGDYDEAIISVIEERWFGPLRKVRWRGSCTVWHNAETGKRAPTNIESRLCDIWTKARWERKSKDETRKPPHQLRLD